MLLGMSRPVSTGAFVWRSDSAPGGHAKDDVGRDDQAGGGTIQAGMVLAIEPGVYWDGGGGLRLEDNFLVTAAGAEKLSSFPDDFR